ncbi:LADA_0A00232g1_1 [Lachancea dasiensis]|uniref:LADA_0A00232g1_1 n=1 Tax=Lachancea dasiensis TaxID=1072105 RepID=A0A1G4ILF4_9SACH|nr:LADA_0A00232g1_1 [Lachancea dasiensis]
MLTQEAFATVNGKYDAIKARNPKAETHFVYAVKTTGIVCRPTCSARIPLLKNVTFFKTTQDAVEAGYRPCKKCRPHLTKRWNKQREMVLDFLNLVSRMKNDGQTVKDFKIAPIAQQLHISKWQLIKVFKRYTGTTPMKYIEGLLSGNRALLEGAIPVVETKRNWIMSQNSNQHEIGASDMFPPADINYPLGDDWLEQFLWIPETHSG